MPVTGNNYYRVKQINSNGSVVYSNVVLVKIDDNTGIAITPNPASGFVNINAKTSVKQIQLLNPDGQLLQTAKPNATVYQLHISNLAAGEYFLRIETIDGTINKKFIKQ